MPVKLRSGLVLLTLSLAPCVAVAGCDADAAIRAWADGWKGTDARVLRAPVAFEFVIDEDAPTLRVELTPEGGSTLGPARNVDYATRFSAPAQLYCDIASGRMNILTTLAQATSSDATPMQIDIPDTQMPRLHAELIPAWYHFFATGAPETVAFGFDHARVVHGGHAVPLYYKEGLRVAWYGLKPGMHVNRDPGDQTNPFDSILSVTAGALRGRFDGHERVLRKGESVFIPAGMAHEFWIGKDGEDAEVILIMTGDGA